MNDTKTRLENCFVAVFPDLPREEITRASIQSIEEWDSVSAVTLLSLIEEEFDVPMLVGDVEEFVSFERILGHLTSGNGQQAGEPRSLGSASDSATSA